MLPLRYQHTNFATIRQEWQNSAIDFWLLREEMPAEDFSRVTSAMLDRPIVVRNLADMPHSQPTPLPKMFDAANTFSHAQLDERAKALYAFAMKAVPEGASSWNDFNWHEGNANGTPTNDSTFDGKLAFTSDNQLSSAFPSRLSGDYIVETSIIYAPDRRISASDYWAYETGLEPSQLKKLLPVDYLSHYIFLHELGHVLQRRFKNGAAPTGYWWAAEMDADRFAHNAMRQAAFKLGVDTYVGRELIQTVEAVKHINALKGLINSRPKYWFAAALEHIDNNFPGPIPTGKDCWYSGYELRLRVYAERTGLNIPHSSEQIHAALRDWDKNPQAQSPLKNELDHLFYDCTKRDAHGKKPFNFKWDEHNDIYQFVPALRSILDRGDITSELTRRNAQLVLNAAAYFGPQIDYISQPVRSIERQQTQAFHAPALAY